MEATERVRISVRRELFAPWLELDDFLASPYRYQKAAPESSTVARWRIRRLTPHLPTQAVLEVTYPDGKPVPGQTRKSTLRSAWAGQDARSRPGPGDPGR